MTGRRMVQVDEVSLEDVVAIHCTRVNVLVESAGKSDLAKTPYLPRVPLLGSKPVLGDRRGDEMKVICAPLPWVEAHDQPCKGSEETQKSATVSVLPEFRSQNPPEKQTAARRNTPVIYFHKNISPHTLPTLHYMIVTPQRGNDILSTPFCKGYISISIFLPTLHTQIKHRQHHNL